MSYALKVAGHTAPLRDERNEAVYRRRLMFSDELSILNFAFAFTAIKDINPNLRVWLSIGGWTFSDSGTVIVAINLQQESMQWLNICLNFKNYYLHSQPTHSNSYTVTYR
jgi:GH18 family chitinase